MSMKALMGVFLALGVLVVGDVAAQDCKINLSQSDMNFGTITSPASSLGRDAGELHALGNRTISLNASCPADANLLLVVRGIAQGEQFRFAEAGQLGVTLSNALLDGRRVDLALVARAGAAPGPYAPWIAAMPGDNIIAISEGLPIRGSVLSVQVEIRPQVPVSELRVRDGKVLEANLAFEVVSY